MEDGQTMTVSPIKFPASYSSSLGYYCAMSAGKEEVSVSEGDVRILTSGGLRIPMHASVLASVSSVLENILDRPRKGRNNEKIVPILGVPSDAVLAFVRYLYSSRCSEDDLDNYGIHLLTLSHVYSIRKLKQRCTRGLAARLNTDNVVDMLQLARLCDAPDLYVKCMKLLSKDFKGVEESEGWRFLQGHDPWLELEILQFLDDAESAKKRRRKEREAQSLYLQLSEAMECLEHICTEGCTSVGPYDKEPSRDGPCNKFSTCQGLQLLIRHFATCSKRVDGGCSRCKRMWQLFRLHSSICECDQLDSCKVPLCRQFKLKTQSVKKGDDARWRLLVRKVKMARVMSSLSLPLPMRKQWEQTRQQHQRRSHGR
ncbi:BTB/POZ and TAZ domain-containing protein 1-like [Macadamia integrifolia]|uniref:BTB/POZ and TAZ domain-containing protein 1-like n=1 Tax=Macadamia integrifolia TaxID=60698 RepID=UPI001C4F2022|nr:BTB/POZ and TAZ domain-containing protein 1-like [Macadamia integrifolia]